MTSPLRRYRIKRGLRNPDNNIFHSYTEEKNVLNTNFWSGMLTI